MRSERVLVLGASGYIGGRLVPELVATGRTVRCMSRSIGGLESRPWAGDVELVEGDLTDPDTLDGAFDGVDQLVYLVHSLGTGSDFAQLERRCAINARVAAERAGVAHVVYMSGLGEEGDDLSAHLRSRHAVGEELAAGKLAVTEVRAAIVLGSGSSSFEMLRTLVDILPMMITPKWANTTKVQPIAVADVLTYLVAAIDQPIADGHRKIEIGAPEQVTYRELMHLYADVAGLRKRLIVPVPVLSPGISSHWVSLITPLPKQLAASLIDSLMNDVVVTDDSAAQLTDHQPMTISAAIESALSAVQDLDLPTHWSGATIRQRSSRPKPWDPDWSGGTVYEDVRRQQADAPADVCWQTVTSIGGANGWYGFGPLWSIRGELDKVVGGVGLRRGRRHPTEVVVGDVVDFWRVDTADPDLFRLRAEMRLPGEAWLEWRLESANSVRTTIEQRARYVPTGLVGRAYWWVLQPFHALIFPTMLRRIVADAEQRTATVGRTEGTGGGKTAP